MVNLLVRDVDDHDVCAITEIYNHYIQHSIATFEEEHLRVEEMSRRIADVGEQSLPWLVATQGDGVLGYAYASRWKSRSAYRFCVEITVYVAPTALGLGVGSQLYHALFDQLQTRDIRVAIACLSLPNDESIALHEKFGMKKVGHFSAVGFKFGQWVDIGYWQLNL